jgi:hypothetical protein
MLLELLESALTACPRSVRAMGYLKEATGIRRRVGRVRQHWQVHIDRCHSMIRRAMQRCPSRRKAVILGGGLLNDVPIAELASAFHDVILVDIVHPFFSRWPTRKLPNVRRLAADVTNTVEALYWVSDEPDLPLPKSSPTLLVDDAEIDLTISINLLSQLPCMPMTYLERQHAHRYEAIVAYAQDVMQAHLDYLRRLPGRVVLISDVERLKIDMLRRVVERKDLLFGLTLPPPDEEWEWRLAPCPEADPKHDFFRRVVGFEDVSNSERGMRNAE